MKKDQFNLGKAAVENIDEHWDKVYNQAISDCIALIDEEQMSIALRMERSDEYLAGLVHAESVLRVLLKGQDEQSIGNKKKR